MFNKIIEAGEEKGFVTGKITDVNGNPLYGALVVVKDTKVGALVGANGLYKIKADIDDVLVFNHEFHKPVEIKIKKVGIINAVLAADLNSSSNYINNDVFFILNGGRRSYGVYNDFNYYRGNAYTKTKIGTDGMIALIDSDSIVYDTLANGKTIARALPIGIESGDLDAVTVMGYRSDRKAMSNVSSVTISSEYIVDRPNASTMQRLQGQVPGLNIISNSGQPGANALVQLRGVASLDENTEPLIIVDGVPVDEDFLGD
ncbi:GldJ protein [Nonlabens ulvanivorans]|nr:TonB-dependent receptor plug domain-containing protein [Nonlabens ulvanivorans]GAK88699.1 GldJ protein [Nonlabens ulvanivorans]